jgi:hypothetical protein
MHLRISALFLFVALSTIAASAQSNQTLTGTVSDADRRRVTLGSDSRKN